MMKGGIWMIALALVDSGYALPSLWDSLKAPQIPLGWDYSTRGAQSKVGRGWGKRAQASGWSPEKFIPAYSRVHHGLIVEDVEGWFYFTDIEIGNPPQTFRAVIDIGWSDTFVPSIQCAERTCAHHRLYDSARSSSYRVNGTAVRVHYSGFYSSGYASTDTLRIGELVIENQAFEEAIELKPIPLWDDAFDSVLGLPRLQLDDPESSLRARSPFHNMIQQGLLRRNLFALKLSEQDTNERGELLIGDVNTDLYVGALYSFPITATHSIDRIANAYLAPGWQVAAHSIAYRHDGGEKANFSIAGYVAAFSTLNPYISLPRAIGENILQYLGADILHQVPCDRRESLPDLVISLGHAGVPFVLKPHEYIRENPQWHWSTTCQVEMALHDEPEDGVKYIILGSVFLARWYSVFDFDNAQISLAHLKGN